jgi:hypothetical protein
MYMKKIVMIFSFIVILIIASIFYFYKVQTPLRQSPNMTINQGSDVILDYRDADITGIVVENSGPHDNQNIESITPLLRDRSN